MKKSLSIQLNMSELIYDIQNKTYLTGRSLSDGTNHSHVAYIQANDDDENEAQILRSITAAYAVLRNRLAEYMEASENTSSNEILKADESLSLSLYMPGNFNQAAARTIGQAAHEFIVATAISDWFAITAKGETSDYSSVAAQSLKVLEEALCKRIRPSRPSA